MTNFGKKVKLNFPRKYEAYRSAKDSKTHCINTQEWNLYLCTTPELLLIVFILIVFIHIFKIFLAELVSSVLDSAESSHAAFPVNFANYLTSKKINPKYYVFTTTNCQKVLIFVNGNLRKTLEVYFYNGMNASHHLTWRQNTFRQNFAQLKIVMGKIWIYQSDISIQRDPNKITAPTYDGRLTKTVLQQLFVTSLLSEMLIVFCHYFVEWQKFNTQIFVVYFTNNFVKAS